MLLRPGARVGPFEIESAIGAGGGYDQRGTAFRLSSVRPDGDWDTADDLIYDSRRAGLLN